MLINLIFKFNNMSMDIICQLLYPLIFIFICMRLYFSTITISMDNYLYKKVILQQVVFKLHGIYFQILEPIIIIKLLIEIILLFYKKSYRK